MIEDEEKLIRLAQVGETGAFDKLYSHYLDPIFRFVYMKVSRQEEAEDLTHEIFLTAWQNIPNYKFKGFPLSSWLYQIARNRVIDHYRLKKNNISLEQADPDAELMKASFSIEADLDADLQLEKVRVAIKKLTDDQQDVLLMRFMEELSHKEIALAINKSEGAVRLIQHRAINELKRVLDQK